MSELECPGELRGCYVIQLGACVLGSGKRPMAQTGGGGGRGGGRGGGAVGGGRREGTARDSVRECSSTLSE